MPYDNEHFQQLARKAALKFLARASPEPIFTSTTKLLDLGCGPGLLSQALAPHVGTILGVDVSQQAVDAFNLAVENQGIPPQEMHAVRADLSSDRVELDGAGEFDVAVCSMTYHHIHDIQFFTHRVARMLRDGGWYFVLDHEDQCGHGRVHSESEMRSAFESAGFADVEVEKAFTVRLWVPESLVKVWTDTKLDELEQRDVGGDKQYNVKRRLMIVSGRKVHSLD